MNEQELLKRKRLHDEPELFYLNCLKIKTKEGGLADLELNKAQKYAQKLLDEQKRKTGKVRAYILKGRQQGLSTYISARYYHTTTHNIGLRTFILTHLQDATDNLFGMVQRYQDNNPIAPKTSAANAKELLFKDLDSGYKIGTAGSKAVGRGETIHNFHGSEVAFWTNAKEHLAGILQAVPDMPGTEIIFESTANGVGNPFYEGCMKALSGAGDYQLIFIPWYWQDEYKANLPDNFYLEDGEAELTHILNNEQIFWRRKKILELGDVALFKQEYPMNVAEAFQATSNMSFIQPDLVDKCIALKDEGYLSFPVQIGVDVARHGDDESVVVVRQGRKIHEIKRYRITDLVTLSGKVMEFIKAYKPKQVAIDTVGMGIGVYDILAKWGYEHILQQVGAGNKAMNESRFVNLRAEMWSAMRDDIVLGIDLPNDERLKIDLIGLQYKYDMRQRLQLESKADMKSRGLSSPDSADALALTYAFPLNIGEDRGFLRDLIEVKTDANFNDYL